MKILLAIDGSPSSSQARDLVAGLPWPAGTVVRTVTVYQPPIDWTRGVGSGMAWVGDAEDEVVDAFRDQLEEQSAPLRAAGYTVDPKVVRGRPATAIVDMARDLPADLVVVGSRGHGPVRSVLLGSVSAEVADQAPCPVLVARGTRVSHLMVATDGSEFATAIADALARWTVFAGVPADVVSVAPPPDPSFELLAEAYTLGAYAPADQRRNLLERHRHLAEDAADRLTKRGVPGRAQVSRGSAGHEIVAAAIRSDADLIVTGARGLRGLESFVLGSVARYVVTHARCSVLVMRATDVGRGAVARERSVARA